MKQNVYSVSQVNSYIKNMISQDFLCSSILIKGELSNVKYHSSGHIYFTLKDVGAAISCVMFASDRRGLDFRMEDGQQVIAGGNIDVFVRDGRYQLYAKQVALAGGGALYEQFERLKRELEEMGMFAPEYKQQIPRYAKRVGVVTAQTGAAIRDIIQVSKRRNPYVQIILYPAIVQGEYAVPSIVRGIRELERQNVDVMIVGRGGGSIEDLWAFNSKEVAQAVFDCRIPIISAVGHETDTTIIDYVADLRAPTPSAAAELAVCDIMQLLRQMEGYRDALAQALDRKLQFLRMQTRQYQLRLQALSPAAIIREKRMRILSMEETLGSVMEGKLAQAKHRLQVDSAHLSAVSPLKRLGSGYAYVTDESGGAITDGRALHTGDHMTIYLKNATVRATVEQIEESNYE